MDYDWYELNDGKLKFKVDHFTENSFGKRFNRLSHEYMLISVASCGGPIALTSDKTKILALREDDPSLENICIFSNEGDIVQRIRLNEPFKNPIICLEFLKDEYLFCLFQRGDIWLIDPHTAEIRELKVVGMLESELLAKGKVFDNGFVVETSLRRYLFAKNAFQPTLTEFSNPENELRDPDNQQKKFWRVFSPKSIVSEKVELQICHPVAGIIQVIETEGKRVFYNQERGGHVAESRLPHLRGIKFISGLSPNNKYIAYFAAEPLYKELPTDAVPQKKKKVEKEPPRVPYAFAYRLIFAPSISSDTLEANKFKLVELPFIKEGSNHLNLDQQPLDIRWCGNRAIIIQFQNQELYLCSTMGSMAKIEKERGEKEKWSYLKDESDGCRILTRKDNKILREIPMAFISVFESFSEMPGALLRSAYMAFEDEEPLQDDQIRKDKDKLARGVEECLASARFELSVESSCQLMRGSSSFIQPPHMARPSCLLTRSITTKSTRRPNCSVSSAIFVNVCFAT
jgi:vacuolar protein sorting-associated protein 16